VLHYFKKNLSKRLRNYIIVFRYFIHSINIINRVPISKFEMGIFGIIEYGLATFII
jgi:hypothetical protein